MRAVILENPSLFSVKDDWSRLHWSIKNSRPQKPWTITITNNGNVFFEVKNVESVSAFSPSFFFFFLLNNHFITTREFTYSLQSAFINSTNIGKIEQLYLNDRAKYCVRSMKQMALLLISWRIIYFIKATFLGSETQRGLSVNKLKLPSKLRNVIHIVSVFYMVMYTLYVIFPAQRSSYS